MQDTIAVIFDFDDTLGPDSTSSFLEAAGVDVRWFWRECVDELIRRGWDPIPAYLFALLTESNKRATDHRIRRIEFEKFGNRVRFFPGVTRIFESLRRHVRSLDANIQVEFYLVSSGIGEILRHTRIAKNFSAIWACDYEYAPDGSIEFPKNIVSFTDKTRYLFQIAKGLHGPNVFGRPFEVNRKVPEHDLRVPFDRMIFVGDGYTDVPCFSLIRRHQGIAIGVYDQTSREKWGRAWGFIEDGRVSNLVPADFGRRSALHSSLLMALESIVRRIAVLRTTYQG